MRMRVYSNREFEKILHANGYEISRTTGDHNIYTNSKGIHITIKYPVNPCISRRLIKEYRLVIDNK